MIAPSVFLEEMVEQMNGHNLQPLRRRLEESLAILSKQGYPVPPGPYTMASLHALSRLLGHLNITGDPRAIFHALLLPGKMPDADIRAFIWPRSTVRSRLRAWLADWYDRHGQALEKMHFPTTVEEALRVRMAKPAFQGDTEPLQFPPGQPRSARRALAGHIG